MLKDRDVMDSCSPCAGIGAGGPGNGGGGPGNGLEPALCAGCGGRIHDRYYLLAVDRQWHAPCLKCCECKIPLDTELTCFARDGNIYCKEDYYRMFAVTRCGRCQAGISANELVMRARDLVYHLHCFTCASCSVPLSKGDHFGMRDGLVYCRPHYELLDYCDPVELVYRSAAPESPPGAHAGYYAATPTGQKGRPRKRKIAHGPDSPAGEMPVAMRMTAASLELLHPSELSSSMESLSYDSSVASPGSSSGQHQSQRTKRMRTSFKHHQLRTMKSYFAINQNPDAKDLKQLAQKTGLSKRVLQVWFQNARAKWRRNIMRQEGQSQTGTGGTGNSTQMGNSPSVANLLGGDSNSLPPASGGTAGTTTLEELHQHHLHHAQTAQQSLQYSDIY